MKVSNKATAANETLTETPAIEVWGVIDQNGIIQDGADNFTVEHVGTGKYRVQYKNLSFNHPPCVVAIGVSPTDSWGTKVTTLQNNNNDSFEIYFKSTNGNFYDCGFNFVVYSRG